MRRDFAMIGTILVLALCGPALSSLEHGQGVVPVFASPGVQVPPPVVTSSSSQYFERTYNRLVAPPVFQPQQPVFIQPMPNAIPVSPAPPAPSQPLQPNVAIAIATTHVAAPVATILLPPYPFGPPPTIGIIPPSPPINVPDDTKESTTQPTTNAKVPTTTRRPEATTPLPAGSDNNFVQALPSNQNVNVNHFYGPPPPQRPPPQQPPPQQNPQQKPQKFKTSVEIVPVPLTYIAPPPLKYQAIKTVNHVHSFLPVKAKVIIRPVHKVHSPLRIRAVRRPMKLVYRVPLTDRVGQPLNVRRPVLRETEPTTLRPFVQPATKPPRV